jgi:signal transduction histidine kinase
MKERAESIGGKFDIVTHPGQGTSIEVTIPANAR